MSIYIDERDSLDSNDWKISLVTCLVARIVLENIFYTFYDFIMEARVSMANRKVWNLAENPNFKENFES